MAEGAPIGVEPAGGEKVGGLRFNFVTFSLPVAVVEEEVEESEGTMIGVGGANPDDIFRKITLHSLEQPVFGFPEKEGLLQFGTAHGG